QTCGSPYTAPQDVFDGTLPAMPLRMARARGATARGPREPEVSHGTVRVEEECLELDVTSPREIKVLRRWLGRVNGSAHSQPYLSAGRIFGAMPPPTKTPAAAVQRSARFPASAPRIEQKLSSAATHSGCPPARPTSVIAAFGSPCASFSRSQAGSGTWPLSRRNR